MNLAIKIGGGWTLLVPGEGVVNADGIGVSWETLMQWSVAEREAFGVFAVPEPAAPPAGHDEVTRTLTGTDRPAWTVTYAPWSVAKLTTAIYAERDRRIAAGFTFAGVRYQSRPFDYVNIGGMSTAAVAALLEGAQPGDFMWADIADPHTGEVVPFAWIAEDNSRTPMDAMTMRDFGRASIAHRSALIFAADALKALAAQGAPLGDGTDDSLWPAV